MIKRTLLAAAILSALPAYAGLTSITAGYDFTDYSGDHGNRNLAYAELVAKVENATLLFNLSQGRRDYETEHFNATRGQGADVVIPIPETSCDIALEIARILGKPYRQGFVKNRYVGRAFIMPGQQLRRKSVRRKLNANRAEFRSLCYSCRCPYRWKAQSPDTLRRECD